MGLSFITFYGSCFFSWSSIAENEKCFSPFVFAFCFYYLFFLPFFLSSPLFVLIWIIYSLLLSNKTVLSFICQFCFSIAFSSVVDSLNFPGKNYDKERFQKYFVIWIPCKAKIASERKILPKIIYVTLIFNQWDIAKCFWTTLYMEKVGTFVDRFAPQS